MFLVGRIRPRRQAWLSACLVLLLALLSTSSARATDDAGDLAGVGLISAGSVAICPPFGGGFEIGAGLGLLLFDPPDPSNACNPVLLGDFLADFPPVQSLPACGAAQGPVADAMNIAMDDMDQVVTLVRAARAAWDRYEGALQIGETACAEDRRQEYEGFRALMRQAGPRAAASLLDYVERQDFDDPFLLSQPVSSQDVKAVRDQIASGGFPQVDQVALQEWAVSQDERDHFQAAYAGLTDPEIDAVFGAWDPTGGATVDLRFGFVYVAQNILEPLRLPSLPLRFRGIQVTATGDAVPQRTPGGDQLVVSNIGSSGLDGVSIDLGPNGQGLEVEWLPLPPEAREVVVSAVGTVNGQPDQSLGNTSMTFNVDSFFDIAYDFAPLNSTTARVEFYLDGEYLHTESGATGIVARAPELAQECGKGGDRVPHPIPLPFPWPPFPGPFPPIWPPIPCYIWEWEFPQPLQVPGSGLTITADEIRILTENPNLELNALQSVDVQMRTVPDSFFDIFIDLGECRYRAVHQGLGQANLDSDANGHLVVSNIGSSGQDGVSIDLEPNEFGRGFEWLPLPPMPPGSFLETQAFGTQNGVEEQFLGSLRLSSQATGQQQLTADYSPLGASQLQLQLFANGELVDIVSNVPAQNPILVGTSEAPSGCGKVFPIPTVLCFYWNWPFPVPIDIPGRPPILADQITVLAQNPATPFEEIDRLTILGADVPDLALVLEGNALLSDGFWNQALSTGQANIRPETSAHGGGLTVSNIGSSGEDGVRFVPDPGSDAFGMFFAPLGGFAEYPQGRMTFDAVGRLQGDPAPRPLGSVHLETDQTVGCIIIWTEYDPIGASGVRFQAFDDGALVADLSLPNGEPILRMPTWPDGCGKEPVPLPFPWPLCIWIDPGQDIPIEILPLGPGNKSQTVIADTFRLLAENPDGGLEELTEWGMGVANIPFVIVGAAGQGIHVTAVPEDAPSRTALHEAVPNPFNPRTKVSFDLSRQGQVKLQVYDLSGRLVDTLFSGTLTAGRQSFTWDGTDSKGRPVASGVYAIRLDSPEGSYSEKVTLVK